MNHLSHSADRLPSLGELAVPSAQLLTSTTQIQQQLHHLAQPLYWLRSADGIVAWPLQDSRGGDLSTLPLLGVLPALEPKHLGDPSFGAAHGVRYAYYAGAMANGIASEQLVIALGQRQILASFGAAGLLPSRIESAIQRLQQELPNGNFACNLIHSPSEEALEQSAVELYLRYGVRCLEASAFLDLTPHIVRYRVAGFAQTAQGVVAQNRVIAKVSRTEVARRFLTPAPEKYLKVCVEKGWITAEQAQWAQHVPMADDVTVEADSGGHTDNRPLVTLLPTLLALRDEIQRGQAYVTRIGAGGGLGTPEAVQAAFAMGAAYVVTGSVNQACYEAGASEHTRKLLAQAEMADVTMAPAADMFEMGVQLQVLKRGTMFPMRARKLFELYRAHESIEEIPQDERVKMEAQIFRQPLEKVWEQTEAFFLERDPHQVERAHNHPKRKMALIFRWYLGLSSRWSNVGEPGREADYQIWCGPAMGAFNAWTKDTYLADPTRRSVVDVAEHLMHGAAYLQRLQHLQALGFQMPAHCRQYVPRPLR
jgi:PfaD family protein